MNVSNIRHVLQVLSADLGTFPYHWLHLKEISTSLDIQREREDFPGWLPVYQPCGHSKETFQVAVSG